MMYLLINIYVIGVVVASLYNTIYQRDKPTAVIIFWSFLSWLWIALLAISYISGFIHSLYKRLSK